jgi:hypothetical protein
MRAAGCPIGLVTRVTVLAIVLLMQAAGASARARFVFEERTGSSHAEGEARWRDALLRASVGGCKHRLPRGSRLRPGIRDCVVNQVHVTNLSADVLECRVTLEFPRPDDDGRRRVEHTIRIAAARERWVATAYGPASLEPSHFESSCVVVAPERRIS